MTLFAIKNYIGPEWHHLNIHNSKVTWDEHSQITSDMWWTFTPPKWHNLNWTFTPYTCQKHLTSHVTQCHDYFQYLSIYIVLFLYCILYFIKFYTNVSLFLTKKMSKEIYWFILFSAIPDRSVKQVIWNLINMFSRYVSKTLLLSINFNYQNHKEIALIGTVGQHVAQAVSATKMAADSQTQDSSHIWA